MVIYFDGELKSRMAPLLMKKVFIYGNGKRRDEKTTHLRAHREHTGLDAIRKISYGK